jgi:uncharacterized membrane protein
MNEINIRNKIIIIAIIKKIFLLKKIKRTQERMKKPTNQKLNQCISFINNIIIKILNQPTK